MADCPPAGEVDAAAVVGAVELALLEEQCARCDEGERRIGRRRGVAHRERQRADDVVAEAAQREDAALAAAALHLPVAVARCARGQGARAGIARRIGQGVAGLVEIDGEHLARAVGRVHGVAPVAVVAAADREAQFLAPVARCAGRQLELGAARRVGVLEARQPLRAGGIDLDALGHAAAAVAGPGDLAAIAGLDRHELARRHLVLARAVGIRRAAFDLDGQLGFRLGGRLRQRAERQPTTATSPPPHPAMTATSAVAHRDFVVLLLISSSLSVGLTRCPADLVGRRRPNLYAVEYFCIIMKCGRRRPATLLPMGD